MIATSIKRCRPSHQSYTMTSPDLLWSPKPPPCSISVLTPTSRAVFAIRFRILLWRSTLEDPPPHILAWSPLTSHQPPLQKVQCFWHRKWFSISLLRAAAIQFVNQRLYFFNDSGSNVIHAWLCPELALMCNHSLVDISFVTRLCSLSSHNWEREWR